MRRIFNSFSSFVLRPLLLISPPVFISPRPDLFHCHLPPLAPVAVLYFCAVHSACGCLAPLMFFSLTGLLSFLYLLSVSLSLSLCRSHVPFLSVSPLSFPVSLSFLFSLRRRKDLTVTICFSSFCRGWCTSEAACWKSPGLKPYHGYRLTFHLRCFQLESIDEN